MLDTHRVRRSLLGGSGCPLPSALGTPTSEPKSFPPPRSFATIPAVTGVPTRHPHSTTGGSLPL